LASRVLRNVTRTASLLPSVDRQCVEIQAVGALKAPKLSIIIISDIRERYFEFYKRLPQRKTPFVFGGE
jgi:hypothetical protein